MTTIEAKAVSGVLLAQWQDLGKKLHTLGEALPATRWEERPAEGVRSADAVFRHLIFWNRWVAETARGGKPDGGPNEIDRKDAPSKAKALAAFEQSVADAVAPLAASRGPLAPELAELYASFLGHTAEHYGQLVVYARLAGVVPPASR